MPDTINNLDPECERCGQLATRWFGDEPMCGDCASRFEADHVECVNCGLWVSQWFVSDDDPQAETWCEECWGG